MSSLPKPSFLAAKSGLQLKLIPWVILVGLSLVFGPLASALPATAKQERVANQPSSSGAAVIVQEDDIFPSDEEFFDWDADDDLFENNFEDMSPAEQALTIGLGIGVLLFFMAISAFECWLLANALKQVPSQYHQISPGAIWLKLIPCFNVIWNFFAYSGVSGSFRNYYHDLGVPRTDFGHQLGTWYSVCILLASIPCLNYCTGIICGPAALILVIIYHIKLSEMKKHVQQIQANQPPESSQRKSPFRRNPRRKGHCGLRRVGFFNDHHRRKSHPPWAEKLSKKREIPKYYGILPAGGWISLIH